MKGNILSWLYCIKYVLASIVSAAVIISSTAFFVMTFNTVDTFIGCALVFIVWIFIMLFFGNIIFKIVYKIFKV